MSTHENEPKSSALTNVNTRTNTQQNTDNQKPTPTPTNTNTIGGQSVNTKVLTLPPQITNTKKTKVVGIRVPLFVHYIYNYFLDDKDVDELKTVIMSFILAKATEKGVELPENIKRFVTVSLLNKSPSSGTVIFNINISKAEPVIHNNINIDLSAIIKKLDEIQQYLATLSKVSPNPNSVSIPKPRFNEIMNQLDDIRKKLSGVN